MTVETSAAPKTKPRWQPVPASKCVGCSKAVYENEKLVADERVFHKTCFKCEHCKKTVSLGNFASLNEKIYCKVRPDSARAAPLEARICPQPPTNDRKRSKRLRN